MKQRPILFSAPMIQAILAGRKTQTRRIVKPSIVPYLEWMGGSGDDGTEFDFLGLMYDTWRDDNGKEMPAEWLVYCDEYPEEGVIPIGQGYGAIGDQLWVKEAWRFGGVEGWSTNPNDLCTGWIDYEAGGDKEVTAPDFDAVEAVLPEDWDWDFPDIDFFSPETMLRWASRILLEITDIRVERLQDISEEDAVAEGVEPIEIICSRDGEKTAYRDYEFSGFYLNSPKDSFKSLWRKINGAESWATNPWVWVVEFKVVQGGDL